MDLLNYVAADIIESARKILAYDTLEVSPPDDPNDCGLVVSRSTRLRGLVGGREFEACDWLYMYALCETLRGGAKVVRPTPELMRVLGHVELNIHIDDYVQPYPGVGVIVPGTLHGGRDCLAVCAWQPGKGITMSCKGDGFHHLTVGPNFRGILEEALMGYVPGEGDGCVAFDRIFRAVLNLNLFAVEQGVKLLPLNAGAENRRRKARHDDRMARLAARDAQEIIIQDLDLILRPPTNSAKGDDGSSGQRQRMHRRRGHWKMQAFGPGRSQRKRIYVHSYMVHPDDDPNGEVQSILS